MMTREAFATLENVVLLLSLSLAGAQESQTLTVFAAASLTDAYTEIGESFTAHNPGVEIVFSFASSTDLATQLVEGAPADVFASANVPQMEVVSEAGRIAEPAQIFAHNRLILVVPADHSVEIQSLKDLADPGVLLVVAAPGVPVRTYTDAMLEVLRDDPEFGLSYYASVLANMVSEEDNVRQVVAKIALGEADAGIVYQSDVTSDVAEEVRAIEIPDEFNQIATYPIAVVSDSPNPQLAQAFIDFVLSDEGQEVLARWGFEPRCLPASAIEVTPEIEVMPTLESAILDLAACE
jgi:molybdate transport system substrate-binding protein